MGKHLISRDRQQGQTLALVAVAMVSFIAIGALAIDLASLYSAKAEIQRAADAAALAGAKAFVDSGVTAYPQNSNLQNLAQTMAQAYVTSAAAQNLVANGAAQVAAGSPVLDFSLQGNPKITVTLQRTGLPLFFARIWGNNLASVSATSAAEAYNPAYSQGNTKSFLPSAPKCVKPILLPNNDPKAGNHFFVDITTGQVYPAKQFIGEQFDVRTACTGGPPGSGCKLKPNGPSAGEYLPMLVSGPHQYCPATAAPGCSGPSSDFEKSIECCDGSVFDFPQCGTSSTFAAWDPNVDPRGTGPGASPVTSGLQCLIHSPNGNSQQDSLDPSAFSSGNGPLLISPGSFSQARYGVSSSEFMATSDSIITVPLFDNAPPLPANHQLTIVGFLTLFVNNANGQNGTFSATITNVSGCGNTPSSSAPVSGGGISSIPVRLIHN